MNGDKTPEVADPPNRSANVQWIIFAVVGALSGIYAAIRLSSVMPTWLAILTTVAMWIVLVVSMSASCGSELLDVVVGTVVIVFVMTVGVNAFAKKRERRNQKDSPAAVLHIPVRRCAIGDGVA